MRIPLLATLALALMLAFAATAEASSYLVNVPQTLRGQIKKVAANSDVPILLPSKLRVYNAGYRVNGSGGRTKNGWDFELGYGRHCGGANACFVAAFLAERGGTPANKKTVALANGLKGYWRDYSCGGSCSPPEIEWVQNGILYTIQSKGSTRSGGVKKTLARLANAAIAAGPRK